MDLGTREEEFSQHSLLMFPEQIHLKASKYQQNYDANQPREGKPCHHRTENGAA